MKLLILIGIVASGAHAARLTRFPNPVGSAQLCGWPGRNTAHVCDPNGVISDNHGGKTGPVDVQQLDAIDAVLADIEGATQCASGSAQISVAAVAKMDGGSGSKADRAQAWAKGLHDKWGVGHKARHEYSSQSIFSMFISFPRIALPLFRDRTARTGSCSSSR